MISSLAGGTEEEPSASVVAVPWTAARAGEAAATAEGCATCASGRVVAAAAGELGPAMTAAPGVEVSAGGVGP